EPELRGLRDDVRMLHARDEARREAQRALVAVQRELSEMRNALGRAEARAPSVEDTPSSTTEELKHTQENLANSQQRPPKPPAGPRRRSNVGASSRGAHPARRTGGGGVPDIPQLAPDNASPSPLRSAARPGRGRVTQGTTVVVRVGFVPRLLLPSLRSIERQS